MNMINHYKNNGKAFSLIELLVALSILAVVAAIIVPRFLNVRQSAAKTTAEASLKAFANTYRQFLALGGTGSTMAGDVAALLSQQATLTNNVPQPRTAVGTAADSTGAFGSATVGLSANSVTFGQTSLTATSTPPATAGFYSTATSNTTASGTLYCVDGAGSVWTVSTTAAGGVSVAALIGTAPVQTTF